MAGKKTKYMAGGGKSTKYMAGGGKSTKYMAGGGKTPKVEMYKDYVQRMFGGGGTPGTKVKSMGGGPAMKKNK